MIDWGLCAGGLGYLSLLLATGLAPAAEHPALAGAAARLRPPAARPLASLVALLLGAALLLLASCFAQR